MERHHNEDGPSDGRGSYPAGHPLAGDILRPPHERRSGTRNSRVNPRPSSGTIRASGPIQVGSLGAIMNTLGWHIAVLIPARDEEKVLPRCLRSVRVARQHLPSAITSDVIVVSDSSTDKNRGRRAETIAQLRHCGLYRRRTGGGCAVLGCRGSAPALSRTT